MKKRKGGFTLLELMAVIAISTVVLTMVSTLFLQNYKIINKVNKNTQIQGEIRNTMSIIETEVNGGELVIYEDNYFNIEGYKGKKLLKISKNNDDILFVEVKINEKKNQLWQLKNYNNGDSINYNKEVLISNLKPINNVEYLISIIDSKNIITFNILGVNNINTESENTYSLSIPKSRENEIIIGNNSGNGGGSDEITPGGDENNNIPNGIVIDFEIVTDWGQGAQWEIKITNNTDVDIKKFKMYFDFEKKITTSFNANITLISSEKNRYELISKTWEEEIKVGEMRKLVCQSEGSISKEIKLKNIEFYYNY